jgi:hypothetical protein
VPLKAVERDAGSDRCCTTYDQVMDRPPVAFVDRYYSDPPHPASQPWLRRRRWPEGREWQVVIDPGGDLQSIDDVENASFDSVDAAIAWARERALHVLVRLGATEETCYSAGEVHVTTRMDGTGTPYRTWPPDRWPDYVGPQGETRPFHPE